jgi:hypothetical protein
MSGQTDSYLVNMASNSRIPRKRQRGGDYQENNLFISRTPPLNMLNVRFVIVFSTVRFMVPSYVELSAVSNSLKVWANVTVIQRVQHDVYKLRRRGRK